LRVLEIVVLVLRFSVAAVLYLFLGRVIGLIYRDLRNYGPACEEAKTERETRPQPQVKPGGDTPAAELIVLAAAAEESLPTGSLLHLGEDNYLGRNETNNVVLSDPYASGRHARIYRLGGRFWVSDLGSRNGTKLNGALVQRPVALANGDILKIGGVTLQFVRWENEGSGQN